MVGFLNPFKQQERSVRNYNHLTAGIGVFSKLPAPQEIRIEYKVFEPDTDLKYESEVAGVFKPFDPLASGEAHFGSSSGDGGFQCPVCGKSFAQAGTLNRHSKLHAGGSVFMCSVCGSKFNRNDNLIRHKRFAHGVFEDRFRVQKTQ